MRNPRRIQTWASFDAYMRFEERSEQKHEWVGGQIYAMSGGTRRHAEIALNIATRLKEKCRGTPCHVWSSDMRVHPAEDVVYYPDASLDCGSYAGDDLVIERPCLVVEVTSRSTRRIDHGEKAQNYHRAASLQTYLIVDQNRRHVTWHHRDAAGAWVVEEVGVVGAIDLPCLGAGAQLTLDEIYEGVALPPLGVAEPEMDEEEAYLVEP